MGLCDYGCGREAKFTVTSKNRPCCESSHNKCPALRSKNARGLRIAHQEGRTAKNPFSGKQGWAKGRKAYEDPRVKSSYTLDQIFIEDSEFTDVAKHILISELGNKCFECGLQEWNKKQIVLELHHNNGNRRDNRRENLKLLCPNCHSQTPTFRRYIKKPFITDLELANAIENSYSYSEACKLVGIVYAGGNVERVKRVEKIYKVSRLKV